MKTLATYDVTVTANGLVPAVIYTGTEGSAGDLISFTFSSDWNGLTKEIMFFDTRGNISITSPFPQAKISAQALQSAHAVF